MHSTLSQAKPSAKRPSNTPAPFPNIITQVQKEDEVAPPKKGAFTRLSACCSYMWKCLPFNKEDSDFDQISEPSLPALLEPQLPQYKGRKVLVLDLDETLVHSTFEPVTTADLVLPVRIQGMTYKINVIKRPGCEEFLARMGELYEVVIFTASLSEYAEPLVKHLDQTGIVASILYRQHCTPMNGIYVKDMALLGRNMKDIILVDNSPNSFLFQPENAYHIKNFFDDKRDRELVRLAHFLERIVRLPDVRPVEELRKKYEPEHINPKMMKFVKVNRQEVVDLDNSTSVAEDDMKKQAPLLRSRESRRKSQEAVKESKESREMKEMKESKEYINKGDYTQDTRAKIYSMTTEPDLRKDDREEEYLYYGNDIADDDDKGMGSNLFRSGAMTERPGADKPTEIGDETELPSPKESDKLISSRPLLNSGNKKPVVPLLAKSKEAFNKLTGQGNDLVVEENKMIDGQKVEDVRLLTGKGNLNSPLGRQVKIDFNEEIAKRKKAKGT